MASRAILRRRRNSINQYFSASASSISSFHSPLRSFATKPHTSQSNGCDEVSRSKDELLFNRSPVLANYIRRFTTPSFKNDFTRSNLLNESIGVRWLSQSSSAATATATKNDEPESDDLVAKKRKEASPEECDQAVEGLTTAKAKAMAKRLQESQKNVQSVFQRVWGVVLSVSQRVWSVFLGIGPALRAVASMSRADWAKKLVHWKDEFVSTLKHYWLGCKLLWADVRISSRLLKKLANGKSLSRREKQQLTRTTADIFRLVPVAVFLIVPFMEFLLPVFLKLFPNMLPSTFQHKMQEEEALKRKLKARIEYAKFLQDTVKEMAKEVQNSRGGELKKTAEDLDDFINMIRKGSNVSNEEILGFAKLFNDELTLDNISRSRLVNMCKYMGINPFGTDAYLRYMLRKHLRSIKEDDKLIQEEGVDSLSEAELREDCRERGMLGLLSIEEMRQQLRDWLDLSLNHSVPSSLLILSRAFTVSGRLKPEEAVQATLSSLPDEVVDTIQVTSLPSEDSVSERQRKLEFLEMQEERIKKEEETEEVDSSREDKALNEMNISTAKEAHQLARTRAVENKDQLCEISRALAVLSSASSVSTEREDFLRLVNKEIELYNSMVEKEGSNGEKDPFETYKAAREEHEHAAESDDDGDKVSSALIERVDAMLQNLEKEIDDVDAKIGMSYWSVMVEKSGSCHWLIAIGTATTSESGGWDDVGYQF
ncbi:hypothetical protein TSUD_80230 [Trifolium subterraneum]|uniref:Letm1 RBD domain-containing protein n=1 Tax=Trifolium subterraneum TaxID=3900 RepID=A0A2Z6MR73_TRISU|nr:hypothetical protein TSUD_80230 [Trifolium subterraneum]